jgi:hypothetical protein
MAAHKLFLLQLQQGPEPINLQLEDALNVVRVGQSESTGALVQLIDPRGNRNIIVRRAFAERWCGADSTWKFEELS